MIKEKWSELDLIALFTEQAQTGKTGGLLKGIGDDCAIFDNKKNRSWITTTDILIEDVHFNLSWHPPHLLGRKSIAVNLSDIAAMGGVPHYALISIAVPDYVDKQWICKWSEGVNEILSDFKCRLIGGDTVKGPALSFNVVIIGTVAKDKAVLRSTAMPGENIYVSGFLGSAAAGLEICRNPSLFASFKQEDLQPLIGQHLDPLPRIHLGVLLGKSDMVGAMQDLSDGIATDLAHICLQSKVGAEIDSSLLPGDDSIEPVCQVIKKEAIKLKISGGEDFELLFTVKKSRDKELADLLTSAGIETIYRVGETTADREVLLLTDDDVIDITFQGYQHRGSHV